jgi:cytochrome c
MRRFAAVVFALLLAAPEARADSAVNAGRDIAKNFCSRCHAIGARGASPNPKSPPFRFLAKKYPLANLEEALGEGIVVGHEGEAMPPFVFTAEQVQALTAYLSSIQRK